MFSYLKNIEKDCKDFNFLMNYKTFLKLKKT